MFQHVLIAVILVSQPAPVASIVTRAETTELRHLDGSKISRVKRDADGRVTELLLTNMTLSREDIEELGRQPELRRLVLYKTNFGDAGVKHLAKCTHLESLNLTSTAVSDDALKDIAEFKNLKYLCLGDVKVTQAAVEVLKERFQMRMQDVRLGYSQRNQ